MKHQFNAAEQAIIMQLIQEIEAMDNLGRQTICQLFENDILCGMFAVEPPENLNDIDWGFTGRPLS